MHPALAMMRDASRRPAQGGSSMKLSWSLALMNTLVIAACLIGTNRPAVSQELPNAAALRETVAETPSNMPVTGGMRGHIHPQTGPPPPDTGARVPVHAPAG